MERRKKDDETDDYVSVYDKVYFDKLVDSSWVNKSDKEGEQQQQVPLFLPPAVFSRMDTPQVKKIWDL